MGLVIVDYGMGNLRSVAKAFRRLGCEPTIASSVEAVARGDRLVLPGVGHFARGMANLRERGLIPVLRERALDRRVPLLGICLGMQLLTRRSDEGECEGLGLIEGETIRLEPGGGQRVPHIGWNTVAVTRANPLLGEREEASFYFVHSYRLSGCRPGDVIATTRYGVEFPSAIQRDNIMGTQFHPEKSHGRGLALLGRFLGTA